MRNAFLAWLLRLLPGRDLDCGDVRDLSSGYVDEALSPSLAAQFRGHLKSCPDCNVFVATFRATVLTLRCLPRQETPEGLEERVKERTVGSRGGEEDPG